MNTYEYDFFVIGGGSGGLSAAKAAATYGKKVALADFVKPTPQGTKWGLGGTCVNVGCIPKKMMHYCGTMYEQLHDLEFLGYPEPVPKKHNWESMVNNVQRYIKKLNTTYRMALNKEKVTYFNAYAEMTDAHTIKMTKANGDVITTTADKILIAVGGRPNYPEVEGAKELCITSDDLFSLKKSPGKTLIIGASYIALVKKIK
jgi:pyruvate/2-oxoglutarate dehydrogenase complex dihydrolipoamide dehydrogenase (E3) component